MRPPSPALLLLLLWAAFIVYGTTLPFDVRPTWEALREGWSGVSWLPWRRADGSFPSRPDMVANVLLFLPLGFLWVLYRRPRGGWARLALLGGLLGLALSSTVEALQLVLPGRVSSTTDLVTNSCGAAAGAVLGWHFVRSAWPRWSPALGRWLRRDGLGALAVATAVGFLFAAAAPFDLSLDVDALKVSAKYARPIPFGPTVQGELPPARPYDRASGLFAWSVAGGVFALALRRRRPGDAAPVLLAGALATAVAAAGESFQVVVQSRSTDSTTVLLAGLGGLLGAALATRLAPRGRPALLRAALLGWGLAILAGQLAPGGLAAPSLEGREAWELLPFVHYFVKTDVHALADALLQLLYYLPFGAALVALGHRLPRAVLAAAAVALALELLQLCVPTRVPETTDAVTAALGAWLGALAWREGQRALAPPPRADEPVREIP